MLTAFCWQVDTEQTRAAVLYCYTSLTVHQHRCGQARCGTEAALQHSRRDGERRILLRPTSSPVYLVSRVRLAEGHSCSIFSSVSRAVKCASGLE